MEGARERGRMAWAWGEAAGREKPGAGGVRGAARAESLSVVSRRPRDPRVAPGPQSRAGSTYLALVEAAAGARVPGVRHGADCAATTLRALPYCPPAAAAPERTTRAAGGGRAPEPLPAGVSSLAWVPCLRPALYCALYAEAVHHRRPGK